MSKKFLARIGTLGVALATTGCLGLGGVAGAASINLTGPDSVNVISSSGRFNSGGSISLTGPGSRNIIASTSGLKSGFNFEHFGKKFFSRCNHSSGFVISSNHFKNNNFFTGNFEHNRPIKKFFSSNQSTRITNNNRVNVSNQTNQVARTGNVIVTGNTVVSGDVSSGNASNVASNQADVQVSNSTNNGSWNSGSSWSGNQASQWGGNRNAVIRETGPDSFNQIEFNNRRSFVETNNNNVNIENSVRQTATSGNVTVSHNTLVKGDVSSGSARNFADNTAEVSLNN